MEGIFEERFPQRADSARGNSTSKTVPYQVPWNVSNESESSGF